MQALTAQGGATHRFRQFVGARNISQDCCRASYSVWAERCDGDRGGPRGVCSKILRKLQLPPPSLVYGLHRRASRVLAM